MKKLRWVLAGLMFGFLVGWYLIPQCDGQEKPRKYILPATPQYDNGYDDPEVSVDTPEAKAALGLQDAANEPPPPQAPKPLPKKITIGQLQARRELGRWLFFDKSIMSLQGTMCCADCHNPDKKAGFGDNRRIAVGAIGQTGTGLGLIGIRNSKSLFNLHEREGDALDWDGRVQGIYLQCFQAVGDPLVLGTNVDTMVTLATRNPHYQELAQYGYGSQGINESRLRDSMVHFLKTIKYTDLPADALANNMETGLPPAAVRGYQVFAEHCQVCHLPEKGWQDYQFHNIGIAGRSQSQDRGRGGVTNNPADNYKFRTPDLRGVPHSPPYMHDGSLATIEEVVDFFADGCKFKINNQILIAVNIDPLAAKINIPAGRDRTDLIAFMRFGFQGDNYPVVENPFQAAK